MSRRYLICVECSKRSWQKFGKLRDRCRKCKRARTKDRRRLQIHRQIGIKKPPTVEQYRAMFKALKGICPACKQRPKPTNFTKEGKLWHLHHNHKTGQWFGIICWRCNLGFGHFYDNPRKMENALNWLKKNHKKIERKIK
jgi:hypothetical protein